MNHEKLLVKNMFIISFGTILPRLTSIIVLPILTKMLSKSDYGMYDLINTLLSLVVPIITIQMHSAAFRFLIDCRNNRDNEEIKKIITNIVFFICICSLIGLSILYNCLFELNNKLRITICLYFSFEILMLTMQQIARGLSYNLLYSISSIFQSVVNMLLIIVAVVYGKKGLLGVIIAATFGSATAFFVLAIFLKIWKYIDFSKFSKKTIITMLRYSWPMVPNSISVWVLNMSDRFVLGSFLGIEAVATYAIANKIPSLFSVLQGTFTMAWQENASLVSNKNETGVYYSKVFDDVSRILFGIMGLLIAGSPVIFSILINGDYLEAYFQMPLLSIAILFSTISSFFGGIYVAHMKTMNVGITTIVGALINIVVDLLLVNYIGIYAASISTVVSYVIVVIYRMFDVRKFQPINYNWKVIGFSLFSLTFMCILEFQRKIIFDVINIFFAIIFSFIINRNSFVKYIKKFIYKKNNICE